MKAIRCFEDGETLRHVSTSYHVLPDRVVCEVRITEISCAPHLDSKTPYSSPRDSFWRFVSVLQFPK